MKLESGQTVWVREEKRDKPKQVTIIGLLGTTVTGTRMYEYSYISEFNTYAWSGAAVNAFVETEEAQKDAASR